MEKIKFIKRTIKLNNKEKEQVNVFKSNIDPYTKRRGLFNIKKEIYVSDNFFNNRLSNEERKAIIYHERKHKEMDFLHDLVNSLPNIFQLLSGLVLYLGLGWILIILIKAKVYSFFWAVSLSFILFIILCWVIEFLCDKNAVKNTSKQAVISSIKKVYDREYKSIWEKIWRELITHPPLRLRFWLINKFTKNENN